MNLFAKILLILMILPVSALSQVDEEYAHTIDSLKALLDDKNLADTSRLDVYDDILDEMSDYGESSEVGLPYYDKGIALAKHLADTSKLIDLNNNTAWLYAYEDDRKCFDYFFKALSYAQAANDSDDMSHCLRNIGAVSNNFSDYGKALEYTNKSLEYATMLNDTARIFDGYSLLAIVYYNFNLYGLAADYNGKAVDICKDYSGAIESFLMESLMDKDVYTEANAQSPDEKYAINIHLDSLLEEYTKKYNDVGSNSKNLIDNLIELYPKLDELKKANAKKVMRKWFRYVDEAEHNQASGLEYYGFKLKYCYTIGDWTNARKYVAILEKLLSQGKVTRIYEQLDRLSSYYKHIDDYKTSQYYYDWYIKEMHRTLNLDYAVKSEISHAEKAYLAEMHAQDIAAHERDIRFNESLRFSTALHRWLVGVIALVVVVLIVIVLNSREANRQNSLLNIQTEEILSANEELNSQQEEIIAQRDELNEQTKQLSEQRNELHSYNNRLVDSITYAERIQRAMVPKEEDIRKIFPESFVIWHPRDIVSGDFYWTLRTESYSYLVTADCTGHGVPGALISMLGISYLNDISSIMDTITTGEILDMLKAKVSEALSMSTQNVDDGMDLAIYRITVEHREHRITQNNTEEQIKNQKLKIINNSDEQIKNQKSKIINTPDEEIKNQKSKIINTPDEEIKNQKLKIKNDGIKNVEFSGAFRPLFVYRDGELTEYKADRMSVSPDNLALYRNRKFKTIDLELQSGDMLYTFSDGIEDQLGGDTGNQKFTIRQLRQLLASISTMSLTSQRDQIDSVIQDWRDRSSSLQLDDQLIIGVRV